MSEELNYYHIRLADYEKWGIAGEGLVQTFWEELPPALAGRIAYAFFKVCVCLTRPLMKC